MLINYDIQKINRTLQDFYYSTGINMDLLKSDFSSVGNYSYWEMKRYCKAIQSTDEGKKVCHMSDRRLLKKCRETKKAQMHICHAGLIDVAAPILYGDDIIGYIIFGQMRTETDFSAVAGYVENLGLESKKMEKLYSEISVYDTNHIESISNIAAMVAKHILLENMLTPNYDESIQPAIMYIENNFEKPLTVQGICKHSSLSKSVLYRRFKSCFDCTVSQYINSKRIEKSIELLTKTNLSIDEISQKVGFLSGSYFSKAFKKEKGISPINYRKNNK